MATKLSKIMTVFVAFASLAFMGFAFVNWAGGPNWEAEQHKLRREFGFVYTPSEKPTWAVTSKPAVGAEESIVTTPVLANAVVKARQHQIAQQQKAIDKLTPAIPPVQAELDKVSGPKGIIAVDVQAMKARGDQLEEEIKKLGKSLVELIDLGDKVGQQTEDVLSEVRRRREDVYRLTSQFEDLQTDHFQILEERKRLRDLLFRMDGILERLERRQEQLLEAGARTANAKNAAFPPAN